MGSGVGLSKNQKKHYSKIHRYIHEILPIYHCLPTQLGLLHNMNNAPMNISRMWFCLWFLFLKAVEELGKDLGLKTSFAEVMRLDTNYSPLGAHKSLLLEIFEQVFVVFEDIPEMLKIHKKRTNALRFDKTVKGKEKKTKINEYFSFPFTLKDFQGNCALDHPDIEGNMHSLHRLRHLRNKTGQPFEIV